MRLYPVPIPPRILHQSISPSFPASIHWFIHAMESHPFRIQPFTLHSSIHLNVQPSIHSVCIFHPSMHSSHVHSSILDLIVHPSIHSSIHSPRKPFSHSSIHTVFIHLSHIHSVYLYSSIHPSFHHSAPLTKPWCFQFLPPTRLHRPTAYVLGGKHDQPQYRMPLKQGQVGTLMN